MRRYVAFGRSKEKSPRQVMELRQAIVRCMPQSSIGARDRSTFCLRLADRIGGKELDRVRTRGAAGFERTVDLSILAANLHRISLIAQGGSASASSASASAESGSPPDPKPP